MGGLGVGEHSGRKFDDSQVRPTQWPGDRWLSISSWRIPRSPASGAITLELAAPGRNDRRHRPLPVNGDEDGKGRNAVKLQHCLGLAFGDGKLYIADTYNNKVKVCDPRNRSVETFVGGVARGRSDDPPRFNEPGGLSLAGSTLYVADTNNHAIRAVDVESRKVRTLDLSTVKPPVRTRSASFANPTVFNLAPVHAMPGREVTLEVAIPLPPGFKLSAEAPINYLAEADPPGSFGTEVSPTGQRLAEPAREFAVKLPLARQARTGSTMTVKFSVSAFVCLPNSLCTVKNYVWNVPITFEPGNSSVVKLSATQ